MLPPRFSVRDIQHEITADGVKLIVTTDVPCHLTMRWTFEKPRTHKDPVLRRGVYFPEKVRFCFVEYHDNEQQEAGDTLIHTFIKEPWAVCETRYYYFWGTVAGVLSPSESPLFSYHRIYVPVPICPFVRQIQASADDCTKFYNQSPGRFWVFSTVLGYGWIARRRPGTIFYRQGGVGLRFLDIPLTSACVVTSATFTVRASGSQPSVVVRTKIRGQRTIDPLTFSSMADYDARPRTVAQVTWDGVPPFVAGLEYTSPDFSPIINEIIGLPGWTPGMSLVLFWDDHDNLSGTAYECGRKMQSWESAPEFSPKLNIDCTS